MPLVEFMMHASPGGDPNKREVPGFIKGSADYHNPADNTYVGWVPDNRDYYLPDTITVLDRDSFIARMMAMHAVRPFTKQVFSPESDSQEPEAMTDEEATTHFGNRYDYIVNHCRTEDGTI